MKIDDATTDQLRGLAKQRYDEAMAKFQPSDPPRWDDCPLSTRQLWVSVAANELGLIGNEEMIYGVDV